MGTHVRQRIIATAAMTLLALALMAATAQAKPLTTERLGTPIARAAGQPQAQASTQSSNLREGVLGFGAVVLLAIAGRQVVLRSQRRRVALR